MSNHSLFPVVGCRFDSSLTELRGGDADVVPGVLLSVQVFEDEQGAVSCVDVKDTVHVGTTVDGVSAHTHRVLGVSVVEDELGKFQVCFFGVDLNIFRLTFSFVLIFSSEFFTNVLHVFPVFTPEEFLYLLLLNY